MSQDAAVAARVADIAFLLNSLTFILTGLRDEVAQIASALVKKGRQK